jgi:hypothetical protein
MSERLTDEQIRKLRDAAELTMEECNLVLNLPSGFDRDQWRAKVSRATATAVTLSEEERGALEWTRLELASLHTPHRTSDHDAYLRAIAVLDRLLGGGVK